MDYKHFSGSKLKIFHKSLKKVKKNTSKLVKFYTDEFVFVTRDSDTPRKKTLKRRIKELAEENEQLNQSSSLEDELLSLLSDLEREKYSLQQKIKGLNSGISRNQSKELYSSPLYTNQCVQTSTKGAATDINDIIMNDIVIIRNDDNSDSKDGIFTGTRYFSSKQHHRKSSSGWLNTYFEVENMFSIRQKKNSGTSQSFGEIFMPYFRIFIH